MEDTRKQLERIIGSSDWTPQDRQWLLQYLEQNDTSALRQLMQQEFNHNSGQALAITDERARLLLERIHSQISREAKLVRMPLWKRLTAAAAVLFVVLTGSYFLFFNKGKQNGSEVKPITATHDVAPGGNKAVLTLGDNSVIVLDNAKNGTLTKQGGTNIVKLEDGQLAYSPSSGGGQGEALYNTVSTPRGGQYQLTLADGSKVWLNAASSLRFPTAFPGKERKVEITGEAYFEIAKDASRPFRVNVAGKQEVEVLGTHFNINAYSDEATINTTLLEGKVKVSALATHDSRLLSPGQQAQMDSDQQLATSNQVDLEKVMAWKNGKFSFGEAMDIESVMRQVSRWYDVEVEYQGKVKGFVGGSISRNVNASQVLQMLELTGVVKFKIENKKVIVMAN